MNRISLVFALLLLSACATNHPVMVDKPIAVNCIPKESLAVVDYPDTKQKLLDAKSPAERYKLLFAGRSVRIDRIKSLEMVISDCS